MHSPNLLCEHCVRLRGAAAPNSTRRKQSEPVVGKLWKFATISQNGKGVSSQ